MNLDLYYEIRGLICIFDNTKNINLQLEKIDNLIDTDKTVLYKYDNEGFTLLRNACILLNIDIIKLLLDKDETLSSINIADNINFTVLHSVCSRKNDNSKLNLILNLLLKNKSTSEFIRIQTINGNTALHYACLQNNINIIKILLNNDPTIDFIKIQNDKGYTALHIMAINIDLAYKNNLIEDITIIKDIIKLLLDIDNSNSFLYITDNYGKTALDISNEIEKINLTLNIIKNIYK